MAQIRPCFLGPKTWLEPILWQRFCFGQLVCWVGSFTERFPHRCNGKSLSWTGLTRERWCCTMGLMSRLDMNTCLTNIKTDILLVHRWWPLLGTTVNTRHLEFKIPNWTRGCSGQTQLRIYQNTHRRSTAETAMNPIGQAFPVIHMHLVVTLINLPSY